MLEWGAAPFVRLRQIEILLHMHTSTDFEKKLGKFQKNKEMLGSASYSGNIA
jgi:hypothetical protein